MLYQPMTLLRRFSCSSRANLANTRSIHWSRGSRAARTALRSAAWCSFCRLVPLAAAISAQERPSRRAASISKISARCNRPTACRSLARSASGSWGPLTRLVRVSAARATTHRAVDPSGVLTTRTVPFLDANRNWQPQGISGCLQQLAKLAFGAPARDTYLISSYIFRKPRPGAFFELNRSDPAARQRSGSWQPTE